MSWTNNGRSKYHNAVTFTSDGIRHDSEKEATRWCELKLLQRAGEISNLERQVEYTLIPDQRDERGRIIERKVAYIADFRYRDKSGAVVVEDVKGMRTEKYIIKRKLMLYIHGIRIKET